jgi:hypothetical protein
MPVQDGDFMLYDGSAALTGTGAGDGVLVGPCPLDGMLISVYRPSDGTSITIKFQESADDSSWTDLTTPPSTVFTDNGTDHLRAHWTEDYLRYNVTANSDDFGAVEIGLVQGGEPLS